MTKRVTRWMVEELVRPIVVTVGSGVEKIYDLIFRERNIRASIERENQLASEIRLHLGFLFREYSAAVVPIETVERAKVSTQHPRPFDWAFAVVALDDLVLKFFRGRGDLCVWVARKGDLDNWGELPLILHWLGWRKELDTRSFSSLQDLAEVLEPRMNLLMEAYSDRRYPETKKMVLAARDREQAVARQLSVELNRKLYG